jgi:beta-galactosidase
VSYYRETVWGLRRDPYIVVRRPGAGAPVTAWGWVDGLDSWSWPGHEGQALEVDVYADADEVELSCQGEIVARAKVGESRRYIASFEIPYTPGDLVAVALREGKVVGSCALRSAQDDFRLALGVDRQQITADDHDLAFVEISLADEAGVVHVLHDRPVTVTVSGPGVLQGLGSGNPRSTDDYTGRTTSTFAGRALAVVRPVDEGDIDVVVEADGCAPTRLTIRAGRP